MKYRQILNLLKPKKIRREITDTFKSTRRLSKKFKVPTLKLLLENILLYVYNDLRRDEYCQYQLSDPKITWREKRSFISVTENHRIFKEHIHQNYKELFKNKLLFKEYFGKHNLRMPTLYGVYDQQKGRTKDGRSLRTAEDITLLIKRFKIKSFVVKPIAGASGKMIFIFNVVRQSQDIKLIAHDGLEWNIQDLVSAMANKAELKRVYPFPNVVKREFLIEERIKQHPELIKLFGVTVCCVRIVTLINERGHAKVLGAVVKCPTSNIGVDNMSQGGIAIGVDFKKGKLLKGKSHAPYEDYRTHLPNGKKFYGFSVPYWDAIIDIALDAAKIIPSCRSIGWDVAIDEKGPIIIEGNTGWGVDLIQIGNQRGMMTNELKETLNIRILSKPAD